MTGVTIEQAIFQDEVSKVHFFGLCFNCQCSYLDKKRLKRLGAWIKSCGMSQWILGWNGTTLSSVEPEECGEDNQKVKTKGNMRFNKGSNLFIQF